MRARRSRAAVTRGVALLEHPPVARLLLDGGRVAGVQTSRGRIEAPVVVDAAGAWPRPVAATAGAAPAVVPTRHQLLITQPLEGVRPEQPIVRVVDAKVYVRPDKGGLISAAMRTIHVKSTLPRSQRASRLPNSSWIWIPCDGWPAASHRSSRSFHASSTAA
jgi:glycine/D-amino acid oxidase-like deaminating enzyme